MASVAYGYVRLSGEGVGDQSGFERQRQAISGFADNYGYETVNFYREINGSDSESVIMSPAFQEMMAG